MINRYSSFAFNIMLRRYTKVGNAFFAGLSGGQKRRLSLAVALLSNPLVLFLDEPTSGLDAAAAASIMRFLKELAVAANIAIVCTIHQPSSAVYNGFDRVMLLSGGKVAFLVRNARYRSCSPRHMVPFTSGSEQGTGASRAKA